MNGRLVSVLVPCYNAERFIADTLRSVAAQTYQPIEIVVVDDGSADRSCEIVQSMAVPNLKLVVQENRGQTAALNAAMAHATGEFVQFLDADDLISPQKIERQMARLVDHPSCVASAEWGRFYDVPDHTRLDVEPVWRDMESLDWLAESRATGLGMMFPALWLMPMALARSIGPWDESLTLNNDAEYFTRVLLASERVLFCQGATCYYRSGISGSLSGHKSAAAWRSQFRVNELCEFYVRRREDSERMRRAFSLTWQHFAHACYPYDATMANAALARARKLHPMRIWPGGGAAFRLLSRAIGWKLARRLQVASGRP
jgi:glycosyltransferase involved in cell wall biosynthesis